MIDYEALFSISYGMYIVGVGNDTRGNAFIANSVFQVSSKPAQLALCCSKENYSAQLISESEAFSISVLSLDTSLKTIGKFGYKSGRDFHKLDNSDYMIGETGVPIVKNDSIAFIECKLVKEVDVGTHIIFIGRVLQSVKLEDNLPLSYSYYRDVKKGKAPKNAPTFIVENKTENVEPTVELDKFKCVICGHIYDPQEGDPNNNIPKDTAFSDLPENWTCPICGTTKDDFIKH